MEATNHAVGGEAIGHGVRQREKEEGGVSEPKTISAEKIDLRILFAPFPFPTMRPRHARVGVI